MIKLTGNNGNAHYLAPAAIAGVTEASSSSQWHGICAIVRTFDGQVLEAADIDGATPRQKFFLITLPLLGSTVRLSIFFAIVGSLQLFDMIMPLTGGGPFNSTQTMVTFLYTFGVMRMKVGFGSAVGVILFIICVTLAFGYKRIFMRND